VNNVGTPKNNVFLTVKKMKIFEQKFAKKQFFM